MADFSIHTQDEIVSNLVTMKIQTKMNDCWYASMKVLNCQATGQVGKIAAQNRPATHSHRSPRLFGRKLSFGSDEGEAIMAENNIKDIDREFFMYSIDEAYTAIERHGVFMMGGEYGLFGCGHFIVIYGANKKTNRVKFWDPAWRPIGGRKEEDWETIADKRFPGMGTILASSIE